MKNLMGTVLTGTMMLALGACDSGQNNQNQANQTSAEQQQMQQSESERLSAFFQDVFDAAVDRSPGFQAYLGIKKDNDKWDEVSEEHAAEELAHTQAALARLTTEFDYDALDDSARLSYDLIKQDMEREIREYQYRDHNYPINTMGGVHSSVPTFLANMHRVDNVDDLEAYIARLNGVGTYFDQVIVGLKRRQEKGIMPPKFVYEVVVPVVRNATMGAPFTDSEDESPIYSDFKRKLATLELDEAQAADMTARAAAALVNVVGPAYGRLAAVLDEQARVAGTDDGVWRLPDGEAFYAQRLKRYTTTDLTADEIHNIGLENVERIHNEMREIMKKVEFEGDLQDFFEFTREDDQFYFPNTDEGRADYLELATNLIATMKEKLPEYFGLFPQADVVVTRVEPFREHAAGKAFYQSPSMDGSRPGRYYANLRDMRQMPIYQAEALAYHEGIPGHHMQRAIAQELKGVPMLQKFGSFTAYTEGWGLYTERLGKDMGFYTDPYSDFGRLAMELWRACRLVVDTGIHSKRWTREQAIQYLKDNTPNPEGDITAAINRYIVMPGQATAYMIGKIKILELREMAQAELGDDFDMRGFHDSVLKYGPVPLNVLEDNVKAWVASQKTS